MDSRDDFLAQITPLGIADRRFQLGFEDDVIFAGVNAFARDALFDARDLERSGAGRARAEDDPARQDCFESFLREFDRNEKVEPGLATAAVRRDEDLRSGDPPFADSMPPPVINRPAGQGFDQFY